MEKVGGYVIDKIEEPKIGRVPCQSIPSSGGVNKVRYEEVNGRVIRSGMKRSMVGM